MSATVRSRLLSRPCHCLYPSSSIAVASCSRAVALSAAGNLHGPGRTSRRFATAVHALNSKPPLYGQPLPETHQHLLSQGEITPGILASEYDSRRRKLADALPAGSVAICVGGRIKYMSQSLSIDLNFVTGIFYKFRQASDFWYLTGFQEPDSAVVLEKTSDSKGYRMTLFVRPKVPEQELWDGACTGVDAAVSRFGADNALPMSEMASHLRSIISSYKHIFVDTPSTKAKTRRTIFDFLSPLTGSSKGDYEAVLGSCRGKVQPLAPEVSKLRAVKSEAEQRLMRQAGEIGGRAHARTMEFTREAQTEAQLAAHFEYHCVLQGAQRLAYVPVVASGANARIIHYTNNDCLLQDDEMILMDGGAEYNGYASDITRSWPASGRFTDPQRDLYQAVLNCEKACIALCTESAGQSLNDLHRKSCDLLRSELKQVGFDLRTGDVERILYPHFLSHPIGIDLHESTYDRSKSLRSGMVVTIEPGVYVPPDSAFPKHYHNIGIRIEDCVLVQPDHSVILSVNAPKEVADVEGCCQRALSE